MPFCLIVPKDIPEVENPACVRLVKRACAPFPLLLGLWLRTILVPDGGRAGFQVVIAFTLALDAYLVATHAGFWPRLATQVPSALGVGFYASGRTGL